MNRKILSLILALTIVSTAFIGIVANAAGEVTIANPPVLNDSTSVLTIEGTVDGAEKGDAVSIIIVNDNVSITDISSWNKTTFKTNVKGYIQTTVNSEGKYIAEISMKNELMGEYDIYASAVTGSKKIDYFFADEASKKTFIGQVADIIEQTGKTDAQLEAELNVKLSLTNENANVAKTFGFLAGDKIFSVDRQNHAGVLLSLLKEINKTPGAVRAMAPASFKDQLDLAAALETVNNGSKAITDYSSAFSLEQSFVNTYNAYVTNKAGFTSYTSGKGLKSVAAAQKCFYDSVLEEILATANGWQIYKYIIEEHGSYMGVNMTAYMGLTNKTAVTDYLTGSYTLATFPGAVKDAIAKAAQSGGGGGGGGSFGGGFSGVAGTIGGAPSAPAVPLDNMVKAPSFSDVGADHWGYEAIIELAKRAIVNGTGEGLYEPERDVTREEYVKLIVLALGLVPSATDAEFSDLEPGAWYQGYIVAAKEAGIIGGISETEFGLGLPVSRQDAATMIYRAAEKFGVSFGESGELFADDADFADYAREAIYALRSIGIINGVGEGRFAPGDVCSRAQSAKMIYEYIKIGEGK